MHNQNYLLSRDQITKSIIMVRVKLLIISELTSLLIRYFSNTAIWKCLLPYGSLHLLPFSSLLSSHLFSHFILDRPSTTNNHCYDPYLRCNNHHPVHYLWQQPLWQYKYLYHTSVLVDSNPIQDVKLNNIDICKLNYNLNGSNLSSCKCETKCNLYFFHILINN